MLTKRLIESFFALSTKADEENLAVIKKLLSDYGQSHVCASSLPLLKFKHFYLHCVYILVAVGLSGILKGKQKLGVTFDSDKLGGIDFTIFSKLSMCSAGAGRCWLVQWPGLPPRHCTWSVLKFL